MIRKIIASLLASVLSISMLASCSQQGEIEKPFVKEKNQYTYVVENSALTLYVDANSNAEGDGSESAPFKTIQEAQAKIRELKAGEGLPVGGITVLVKDGEYKLDSSLIFNEEDSGTEECPITYVSETEFGAVLTGGLILSADDFEPLSQEEKDRLIDETSKNNVLKVDLSKYGIASEDIVSVGTGSIEVFVNGERVPLSRYPNEGFTKTKGLIDPGDTHETFSSPLFDSDGAKYKIPGFSYEVNNRGGTVTVFPEDNEHISKWLSHKDIYASGYFKWSWSQATVLVGSFDIENESMTMANAVTYGLSQGAPFYFMNVYEEMDVPGEYFIDKENCTLYMYKPNDFENAEIMMSELTSNIISASNISHMTFKGFVACAVRSSAVVMSGNNITIDNCKIYNILESGINLKGMNNTVSNCELFALGASGISVNGGNAEELVSGNCLVYNNYIHHWAQIERTYRSAISIDGCGNTASHNEMHDSPHQAVGWYGPNHVFEYNEIYNVCTETSDCGAIYSGRTFMSYGCIFRYNYLHEIGSNDADAHGIYWDDGLAGQTAYGNIIVNSTSDAFAIGGGRDNKIYNNIIIDAKTSAMGYDNRVKDDYLADDYSTYGGMLDEVSVISSNEIWMKAFPEMSGWVTKVAPEDTDNPKLAWNPVNVLVKNNIYYTVNVQLSSSFDISTKVRNYSDVSNNYCLWTIEDFPGYHNGDYTLKDDSALKKLCPEFEIIPFSEIGRIE